MAKVLFRNVNVLDCTGAPPFAGQVLVDGNRITAIVPKGVRIPNDGARVLDGAGATLMPGLLEAHGHPSFLDTANAEALGFVPIEEHTLRTAANARTFLDRGFTSCHSAASAKARLDVVVRNAINAGDMPGLRLRAASPELTTTAGLGYVRLLHMHRDSFAIICDGAEEFRKAARTMVREGVDTLKINVSGDSSVAHASAEQSVMTEAEIDAVCDVGRKHGKRVAAHARNAQSVQLCVKHGVEVIYHATLIDDAACAALESSRDWVFVAPTLGITYTTLHEASDWGVSTELAESRGVRRELDAAIRNMKELKRRGVRILPGGDYGFAWNPIGTNARDIEHFVKLLGYSPMEAILAATKLGGEIMQMGGELGQVKEGYLADLILVDGNPLASVKILQDADSLLAIMKMAGFTKRREYRGARNVKPRDRSAPAIVMHARLPPTAEEDVEFKRTSVGSNEGRNDVQTQSGDSAPPGCRCQTPVPRRRDQAGRSLPMQNRACA
jgi:imidazolonepropionase-like amidohydrolase